MKISTDLQKKLLHIRRRLCRKTNLLLAAGWLLSSLILAGADQIQRMTAFGRIIHYQEGDFVTVDYTISQDLSFINTEATEKLIAFNRSLANRVYIVSGSITQSVLEKFDKFIALYMSFAENNIAAEREKLIGSFPGLINLVDKLAARDPEQVRMLLKKSRIVLEDLQYAGIFHTDGDDSGTASGTVDVVYSENNPAQRVILSWKALIHPENLVDRLRGLESLRDMIPENREFAIALVSYFAEVNAYRSKILTEENIQRAEINTVPVEISVAAGTKLLSAGEIVNNRQARILQELEKQRSFGFDKVIDPLLFMLLVFIFAYLLARCFNIWFTKPQLFWFYSIAGAFYLLTAILLHDFVRLPAVMNFSLLLPTAFFILLITQLLQSMKLALLTAIIMSVLTLFLSAGDIPAFFITLASGTGAILSVRRKDTGMTLLRTGLCLTLIMFSSVFIIAVIFKTTVYKAVLMALIAAGNGIISDMLSMVLLPYLGMLLNTATTLRLVELSDHNMPILKKMRLQAPGTFFHSQNVAQLAEAACDAVNADGLLARVGAYYHDIGKIEQAGFFVENQSGDNKHDGMKARLSAAVIRSHVKIGLEKGREIKLPDEVLAIIEQHHGTSLIQYFYDRAVKESKSSRALHDDYSYGGPKPRSREAAVVMLADSVEATARAIREPTSAKLEKIIWNTILNKFNSGELSESSLTMKDLETVKKVFAQVLMGHFHVRIEYPENLEKT